MIVGNTFMNMGGGESMKDLTPFVSVGSGGEVDYAEYSIIRYPGTGSNYTHFFSGYVHFSNAPYYGVNVSITIPESYKINAVGNLPVAIRDEAAVNSYSSKTFRIINNGTVLTFNGINFQGFIFPTFLCRK